MGSGNWLKAVISLRRAKQDGSKQVKGSSAAEKSNGFKWRHRSRKESNKIFNGASTQNASVLGMSIEDLAATRIQTAFRGYLARKTLRSLKGAIRLQALTQGYTVSKQASTTLGYIKAWSKVQSQIGARRLHMVTEGRLKQKKLDNQLKLETKLHELEVEWCGGSETMEEILARIQQREVAAVKRERAMAYAFTHQWRAHSGQNHGPYDFSKGGNWGWSWKERWVATRPWESRVPSRSTSPIKISSKLSTTAPKKVQSTPQKLPLLIKPSSNGKTLTSSPEKLINLDDKVKVVTSSSPKSVENPKEKSV